MRKILALVVAVAISALFFQSCQPVDNSKALAKADSLATARLGALKDSLNSVCMDSVMAKATAKADSMMQAAMKKGGASTKKKPTTSTSGTVKDRPGATNTSGPEKVTDRQGTTNTSGPKSVTDRSGAAKKDTVK